MLCSRLDCQKVFKLKHVSYKIHLAAGRGVCSGVNPVLGMHWVEWDPDCAAAKTAAVWGIPGSTPRACLLHASAPVLPCHGQPLCSGILTSGTGYALA